MENCLNINNELLDIPNKVTGCFCDGKEEEETPAADALSSTTTTPAMTPKREGNKESLKIDEKKEEDLTVPEENDGVNELATNNHGDNDEEEEEENEDELVNEMHATEIEMVYEVEDCPAHEKKRMNKLWTKSKKWLGVGGESESKSQTSNIPADDDLSAMPKKDQETPKEEPETDMDDKTPEDTRESYPALPVVTQEEDETPGAENEGGVKESLKEEESAGVSNEGNENNNENKQENNVNDEENEDSERAAGSAKIELVYENPEKQPNKLLKILSKRLTGGSSVASSTTVSIMDGGDGLASNAAVAKPSDLIVVDEEQPKEKLDAMNAIPVTPVRRSWFRKSNQDEKEKTSPLPTSPPSVVAVDIEQSLEEKPFEDKDPENPNVDNKADVENECDTSEEMPEDDTEKNGSTTVETVLDDKSGDPALRDQSIAWPWSIPKKWQFCCGFVFAVVLLIVILAAALGTSKDSNQQAVAPTGAPKITPVVNSTVTESATMEPTELLEPSATPSAMPSMTPTAVRFPTTITIQVFFDDFADETGWVLRETAQGDVVADSPIGSFRDGTSRSTREVEVFYDVSYTFTIQDSFGDGLCCDTAGTYFVVHDEDDTILATGAGNFGFNETSTFTIEKND